MVLGKDGVEMSGGPGCDDPMQEEEKLMPVRSRSQLRRLAVQKGGGMYDNDELTGAGHARYIADKARDAIYKKYMSGQEEHGGKLWRKVVTPHILEEAIDQIVYVLTLRDQLEAAEARLGLAISTRNWDGVEQVHKILANGNPDGREEEERNP